jgi:hypothetical protein
MACHLGLRSFVTAFIVTGLSGPVTGDDATGPTVVVEIFDQAGLASEVLSQAKHHVSRLYSDVGVAVVWTDAGAKQTPRRFVIRLIIRPKPPRSRMMGNALGNPSGTGGTAFVYRDRVLDVARARDLPAARVLAYAMAHEIGHLLLPYPSHAVSGIMSADWDGTDFEQMRADSLRFTPAHASAIRVTASASCVVTSPAGTEDARLR